jgi:hypothetical protein
VAWQVLNGLNGSFNCISDCLIDLTIRSVHWVSEKRRAENTKSQQDRPLAVYFAGISVALETEIREVYKA